MTDIYGTARTGYAYHSMSAIAILKKAAAGFSQKREKVTFGYFTFYVINVTLNLYGYI